MENDLTKTRKLIKELADLIDKHGVGTTYNKLSMIINSMAVKYNLEEEEIHKQLELLINSIK